MAEVVYKATKSIESWLAREGLTLDSLQALPPNTQGQLGRQWKDYQNSVAKMQDNLKCSDTVLELYELKHKYASPDLGNLDVARHLGRHRTWEKSSELGTFK